MKNNDGHNRTIIITDRKTVVDNELNTGKCSLKCLLYIFVFLM